MLLSGEKAVVVSDIRDGAEEVLIKLVIVGIGALAGWRHY